MSRRIATPYALSVRRVIVDGQAQLLIEDAAIESGQAVDVRLLAVPGITEGEARAKLKGRCFIRADEVRGSLGRALHAIGQPGIERVDLRADVLGDKLDGRMARRVIPWVAASFLITIIGARSLCIAHRDGVTSPPSPSVSGRSDAQAMAELVDDARELLATQTGRVQALESEADDLSTELVVRVAQRCEPLEWSLCAERGATCSPMADGTDRRCRRRTRAHGIVELVCVPGIPGPEIKHWRRTRLRTIVDAICSSRRGCRANPLTDYLTVLADRETDRRPWKRHRMDVDRESAAKAWRKHAIMYKQSPAHGEPWRWTTGLGYYGQNPALWLASWDESAVPEILCGEVESTLVHLRGARRRFKQLRAGVDCDGETFHGSADGSPSWYDVSLVNSGSKTCPAQVHEGKRWAQRLSFERRAARFGFDPYAPITLDMLGEPIERETQDVFAAALYVELITR